VPAVSIAFLRTLVDPVTFTATNSTDIYKVTGTVTTLTNLTSGNTSSYYLQDNTAGINIFATFAQTFRPTIGDVVTYIGFLSSFRGTLELEADTVNNTATSYTVLSNNVLLLPTPITIPYFTQTNANPAAEAVEGSIVSLTNVFFGTNAGAVISTSADMTIVVTNASGAPFSVNFSLQDLDTVGQTLPSTALAVIGPLNQATNTHAGYQVTVTRFSDIVEAVPLTAAHSGNTTTLTWPADPFYYSVSVLAATTVTGPYAPLVSGLVSTNTSGMYLDTGAGGTQKFYRLSHP
jgi:hypothetical protein